MGFIDVAQSPVAKAQGGCRGARLGWPTLTFGERISVLTTRRSLIAGATAAGLLGPITPARAIVPEPYREAVRQLMAMKWMGRSSTKSDQYRGGEFSTGILMKFQLNDDFSFIGAMLENLKLENVDYMGQFRISGEAWVIGGEIGMSIYKMQFLKGDPLPAPLAWGTSKGDFRFYNDSSRKGHFTMHGVLTDDVDRTQFKVILVDQNPD